MIPYAIIAAAVVVLVGVVGLAIFVVRSTSVAAGGAAEVAKEATADAAAANAALVVANKGESDAQTLDRLNSGGF